MNRRVKIVALPVEALLHCLGDGDPCFVTRIHFPKLPDNYRVEGVFGHWERRCIDVMVSHDSFPEVPIGEQPERMEGPMGYEYTTFARVIRRGEPVPVIGCDEAADSDLPVYREVKL